MTGESLAQGWRAVARGFQGLYDYIGTTMVVSALWFLIGFTPTALSFLVFLQVPAVNSFLIFAACWVALLGPATAAVYSAMHELLDGEMIRLRDMAAHFAKHYKRAAALSAVMGAVLGVLVVDVIFFTQLQTGWSRYVAIIWGYFILFWALTAQYVFPFLITRDVSVWQVVKMAALMAADNVVATLVVAFFTLLVLAASVFLRVPVMLFMIGTFAFLHVSAFRELIKKYVRPENGS